ncbi:MAG TPA: HD domain-containing protein [Egibacteraceae bacterium]|nr:HD domain-containing protein [Egibacteraceae bacterium]
MDAPSPFLDRTRQVRELAERDLAPAAARAAESKGRDRPEEADPYRTAFERDRDRILHSKAFRRLKHKTQVFIQPEGDHTMTRLTHALQVTQIARALASALGLNEALAEAIALGHDVGHSPFGHIGEEALEELVPGGWHHAAQSVRIYEVLEPENLTWEVRDGIRAHSWKIDPPPATLEGGVVRFADRIAYLSHDVLDSARVGVLDLADLPERARKVLGDEPGSAWIHRMIHSVVQESLRTGRLVMEPEMAEAMDELRDFMFAAVYQAEHREDEQRQAKLVVRQLAEYHLEHPALLPPTYRDTAADPLTQVVDFVAGMTDRYAMALHDRLLRR